VRAGVDDVGQPVIGASDPGHDLGPWTPRLRFSQQSRNHRIAPGYDAQTRGNRGLENAGRPAMGSAASVQDCDDA